MNDTPYEFLKQQDGYSMRVETIKLNTRLYVPFPSNNDEDGDRDFTSDMNNEIIYIDKVGFEYQLIAYKAKFEIIGQTKTTDTKQNKQPSRKTNNEHVRIIASFINSPWQSHKH